MNYRVNSVLILAMSMLMLVGCEGSKSNSSTPSKTTSSASSYEGGENKMMESKASPSSSYEEGNVSSETKEIPIEAPKMVKMELKANYPTLTVYKSETCGCCNGWIEHMKASGFKVVAINSNEVEKIKREVGVPEGSYSCHTAKIGNYFIEGHIPADDVKRLLKESPKDVKGLVVPGMPVGSPGMEMGNTKDTYTTYAVNAEKLVRPFQEHKGNR